MFEGDFLAQIESIAKQAWNSGLVPEVQLNGDPYHVIEDLQAGGNLSHIVGKAYKERPTQIDGAKKVSKAVANRQNIVAEMPTGSGKSFAYGVVAARSGLTVVISTANKALQDQLFIKDFPVLQQLKWFELARLKGMTNYLCRDAMKRLGEEEALGTTEDAQYIQVKALMTNDEEFSGDFEEINFPLMHELRDKIRADRYACAGKDCPFFKTCYYYQARAKAMHARILIVNHWTLLENVLAGGHLLPKYDLAIIDEAHKLEDAATSVFTTTIEYGSVTSLLARKLLKQHTSERIRLMVSDQAEILWQLLSQRFFKAGASTKIALNPPVEEGLTLASSVGKLAEELAEKKPVDLEVEGREKDSAVYDGLVERTQKLANELREVFSGNIKQNYVYSLERKIGFRKKESISVSREPVSIAPLLQGLYKISPVVCTSATLATPDFSYFLQQVGLDEQTPTFKSDAVFDYGTQALLYTPRDIPAPYYTADNKPAPAYLRAMGQRMLELVRLSRGRAFLLFTSKTALEAVYEQIKPELSSHLLLRQGGDIPNAQMIEQFKASSNAVLFGMKTFWEGVDIPGEALSLVVIDKLPFEPGEPLNNAREKKVEDQGKNKWRDYKIPRVILQLKQATGRLICTNEDRGVMAILNSRLWSKDYGKQIFTALPEAKRTDNIQDIEDFFKEERASL